MESQIRIMVDRSRDSTWCERLLELEPDDRYRVTDNKGDLTADLLARYHVLVIPSCTSLTYREEELRAIESFVGEGGGLILASSTGVFETEIEQPVDRMGINRIAEMFGVAFLPPSEAKGDIGLDRWLRAGYDKSSLCLTDHEMVQGKVEMGEFELTRGNPLRLPHGARIFLKHKQTGDAVGGTLEAGKGRAILLNTIEPLDWHSFARALIDWAAPEDLGEPVDIPDEIPVEQCTRDEGTIHVRYDERVADRVDLCIQSVKKITEAWGEIVPEERDASWEIEITPSCSCDRYPSWGSKYGLRIGGLLSDAMLAHWIGYHTIPRLYDLPDLYDYALNKHFAMKAMGLLGFEEEAERMRRTIEEEFRKKDPSGKAFDLRKIYDYHPKAVWVWHELEKKCGPDLFKRMVEVVPKKKARWDIPGSVYGSTDVLVYYLSLAAEQDLAPWFERIGTTVRRLPLMKNDDPAFKGKVIEGLEAILNDREADPADRIDAISGLMQLGADEEDGFKNPVAEAVRLMRRKDGRAAEKLHEVLRGEEDEGLKAIAALNLVQLEDKTAASILRELALRQSHRFQLEAVYSLEQMGETSIPMDFVEFKTEWNGELGIFPVVDGHKVANVFTGFPTYHFPRNTHVTMAFVEWVYTRDFYRRRGLSRKAFAMTMKHPSVRRCSCAALDTGTRNVAHAMYRSFGFVDTWVGQKYRKKLEGIETAPVVEGILIRGVGPGDETDIARLLNEYYREYLGARRQRAVRQHGGPMAKLAVKGDEIVGYASAWRHRHGREESARLGDLCVRSGDDRELIGMALLSALHNTLWEKKIREIVYSPPEDDAVAQILHRMGYTSSKDGGVDLFKIVDLPMLLRELSPLLELRLAESKRHKDWEGRVGIVGDQHRAALILRKGRVQVDKGVDHCDVLISGSDDTITRIVAGRQTPFEAYLQTEAKIQPGVNQAVEQLVDTLFPRMPMKAWW